VLQKIQQRLSGWILWVLVIIISLGFMLWGVENYFQQNTRSGNQPIGQVNGVDLLPSEVARAFNAIAVQMARQNDNQLPQYLKPMIEQQAIDSVITSKVIQTLSKKLGFAYSQDEVKQYLPNFSAFIQDGEFSQEKFYGTINSLGYSSAQDFIDTLRSDLIESQIKTGLVSTELATQAEFEFWAKISEQERDFEYLTIPAEIFDSEVQASEEDINEYYNKYKQRFKVEELVKLEYVELLSSNFKDAIEINNEDIREYYEDNKTRFTTPKRWHVAHIWLRKDQDKDIKVIAEEIIASVNKGKSFSELAKKYSDDKLTASKGGKLHWFTEGGIKEEFELAVKKLTKEGEISEIVETDNGIEIFQLLEFQYAIQQPFNEVATTIKEKLVENEINKKLQSAVDELEDISYANPDSLVEVANEMNLEIKETGYFSKNNPGKYGITKNTKVIDASYHKDVYEDENNSLPVRIADDHIVVLRIKDKQPERIQSLEEVRDELKSAIELKMKREKTQEFVKVLVEELKSGESIDKQLKKYQLEWKSLKSIKRSNQDISRSIIALVFSIEGTSQEQKQFPNGAISKEDFGIINVDKIVYPDPDKLDNEAKLRIYNSITRYYSSIMYGLYIDSLKSQSEIKMQESTSKTEDQAI
jgi:peptidyl-prolyl cis-trans isomerase D